MCMFSGDLRGVCEAFFTIIFDRTKEVFIMTPSIRELFGNTWRYLAILFEFHDVELPLAIFIGVFNLDGFVGEIHLLQKVGFLCCLGIEWQ